MNVENVPNHHTREVPHIPAVVRFMKLATAFLLVSFFILPALLKFYPEFLHFFVFLNYVRQPMLMKCDDPLGHGLNKTFNFMMHVDNETALGSWHVMPTSMEIPTGVRFTFADSKDFLVSDHPVVFYLHGNAGYRGSESRVELYKKLADAGFHVVTFDYRGYGDSKGQPSRRSMVEDSVMMVKYVRKTISYAKAKLVIWGHSLGTAIALETAKRLNVEGIPFDALVLESPFTNIGDIIETHPIFSPIRILPWYSWILPEAVKKADVQFPSDLNILQVREPIMILHAEDDLVVSHDLGKKLYEISLLRGSQSKAKFVTFPSSEGFGHKYIYKYSDLVPSLMNFLNETEKPIQ